MLRIMVFLATFLVTVSSFAQTALISLSENSALMRYSLLVGGQSFGRSESGIGLVYNENGGYLFDASFQVVDEAGSRLPNLLVGIGGKIYGGTISDDQFSAIGLGTQLRYSIPGIERLNIGFDGYYAPSVVSWLDATSMWELAGRLGYEVLPQAIIYIEYRQFAMTKESVNANNETFNQSLDIDASGRFGIQVDF